MGIGLASRFAFKNIKANKVFVVPFILSGGIMIALFNIMTALLFNKYVNSSFASLPIIMGIGMAIVGIFSFMFMVYANRFIVNRRNKEFSLYGILGLEKKHIVRIMFVEQILIFIAIGILSIGGGYVLGKAIFLLVNKITQNNVVALKNYVFSGKAAIWTLAYIAFIFVFEFLLNVKNISSASPIELLSKDRSGEKEPPSRKMLAIAGLFILGAGYYLALTTEGNLKSLGMFFLASVLVIIATYILFLSFSIVVLKLMKKNKNKYYKPSNFISISGMIYRMRGNALGLASIAVLCTGVIITVSATFTLYKNMNSIIETTMPRYNKLTTVADYNVDDKKGIEKARKSLEKAIYDNAGSRENVKNLYVAEEMFVPVYKDGNNITPSIGNGEKKGKFLYIMVNKIGDYNAANGKNIKLADNEVMYSVNNKIVGNFEKIRLAGKSYNAEVNKEIKIPGNIAVETIKFIVNDDLFDSISKAYEIKQYNAEKPGPTPEYIYANWDMKNETAKYEKTMLKKAPPAGMSYENRNTFGNSIKEIYGGILFLGIVIGIVFMIGTVLITYYKQLSEGYEDRKQYQIMKKVGLPDELIKKTAEKQIVWMFFIPLAVALIHSLVASKIVYQLLILFGVNSYAEYGVNIGIIIGAFALVYFVIFKITSSIYYKIVK